MDSEMLDQYCVRRSGSAGCEIVNPDGVVIAWASAPWAHVIVMILNIYDWPPFSALPHATTSGAALERDHDSASGGPRHGHDGRSGASLHGRHR